MNANKQLAGKVGKNGEQLKGKLLFYDVGGDPKELMAYMVKSEYFCSVKRGEALDISLDIPGITRHSDRAGLIA